MRRPFKSNQPPRLLALRRLLAFVALAMVLAGQSAAIGCSQSTGGTWIEICGNGDTKMVLIEGETPLNDCSHCDYCTMQLSTTFSVPPGSGLAGPIVGFTFVQLPSDRSTFVVGAEQYWAANRGPPKTSEENIMTFLPSLFIKEPAEQASNLWTTPWI